MRWSSSLLSLLVLLVFGGCQDRDRSTETGSQKKTATSSAKEQKPLAFKQLHNEAAAAMGQFDFNQAVQLFERLQKARPALQSAQVDLAIALLNRRAPGDLERSAQLLDKQLAETPEDVRALYCRGLLYFNEGKIAEAESIFEQVLKIDATDAYAVYYIGQCRFMRGAFSEALESFQHAQQIDPYLRSAYYGAFQAAQRLKDDAEMRSNLTVFQKLGDNPRSRVAELKYTRMGPKAEVAKPAQAAVQPTLPNGPLFADPIALPVGIGTADTWGHPGRETPNITVADINNDGESDIFFAGISADDSSTNVVLLRAADGYQRDSGCPLENVSEVTNALWGDYDADGLCDVYLCRKGPNQLWRQSPPGEWTDVTATTETAAGNHRTTDGACYDADHDGDLDYLLVNFDGPCELLNNNGDGTFRSIAKEIGLQENSTGTRQVLIADLDSDDDSDIVLLREELPHQVLINDRLWEYHSADNFETFAQTPASCAVASDVNVDGEAEIYTLSGSQLLRWTLKGQGGWQSETLLEAGAKTDDGPRLLAIYDFDGDTKPEAFLQLGSNLQVLDMSGKKLYGSVSQELAGPMAVLVQPEGPALLGIKNNNGPVVWPAGTGRFPYVLLSFTGKEDAAAEMRSNASGIGVIGAARIGEQWSGLTTFRSSSGPGQSLQPIAVGLGDQSAIDFIQLLWPDGVSQTEQNLTAGKVNEVVETQRQSGSCPLVFVWNGAEFEFVADVLGAGGIGFNLGKGEYFEPRPQEGLLISSDQLRAQEGRLIVKLGEPMEELCYFDAVRLVAYDLPPGWCMALDERFGGLDPQPTGDAFFFTCQKEFLPSKCFNQDGQDVTSSLLAVDKVAAPLNKTENTFIGFADHNELVLTFSQPLDQLDDPILLFDGWVEYAYSQSAFAAWQAGVTAFEPTLEARGANNQWRVVRERFGFPAGTPRRSAVRIPSKELPHNCRELRISTNMQVYWDRITVVEGAQPDSVSRQELALVDAYAQDVGFSMRRLQAQRYTTYDYSSRPPLADTRHPAGFYTEFGDALELVTETDDALAIIGPGEELHLEFASPQLDCPESWKRYYVLETDGWCKDADLFTKGSGSVGPLPRGLKSPAVVQIHKRDELNAKYNTRYRSGR